MFGFKQNPTPISLNDSFFGMGALSRSAFRKNLLKLCSTVFISNIVALFLYYYGTHQDNLLSWRLAYGIGLLINVSGFFTCGIFVIRRLRDLLFPQKLSSFKIPIVFLLFFPLSAIYFITLLLTVNGRLSFPEAKPISITKHALIALLLPFLLIAPLRFTFSEIKIPESLDDKYSKKFKSQKILKSYFSDNLPPSFLYISNHAFEAALIFNFKENAQKSSEIPLENNNLFIRSFGTYRSSKKITSTASIVGIALSALYIFEGKNQIGTSSAALHLTNSALNFIPTLEDRNTLINQNPAQLIYLFIGNIEIPVLQFIDDAIFYKFMSISEQKLTQGLEKIKNHQESSINDEPNAQLLEKINSTDAKLKSLRKDYSLNSAEKLFKVLD